MLRERRALAPDDRAQRDSATRRPHKPTIAYAVSVTKDGSYIDGAAVLAHSVIRVHREGQSHFGVDLVAFVAPAVSVTGNGKPRLLETQSCRRSRTTRCLRLPRTRARTPAPTCLPSPDMSARRRDLPLAISEIKGDFLRSRIESNGCCGAWELLKLYSWTLTEYHRVVHLDMDALILQNLDELYDDDSSLWNGGSVKALYTYDWTMARPPWGKNPPTQGGFIVAKPDIRTFEALIDVVRQGDFRAGSGWGGTHIGSFWGGMTIQGLVPYFFEKLHPGTGRAVDNCVYNNMANNPRSVGGFDKGECRDGTVPPAKCKDCRLVELETVKSTHFTICDHQSPYPLTTIVDSLKSGQKPWGCTSATQLSCPYCPLCAKFHKRWFDIRKELEVEWGTYDAIGYSGDAIDRQGMCGKGRDGQRGYKPVPIHLLLQNETRTRRWRASWQSRL